MNSANYRRLYNIAAAVVLARVAGIWLQNLWAFQRKPLAFDDSYMFARYAMNIRRGLGISWNLDGVHTYGQTSPLWGFFILVLSYLPLSTWKMLTLGSWICSLAAVVALSWAVAANARSEFLASTWRVLPLVVLPLADTLVFSGNQATGMETMLATLLCAVFVGLTLSWARGVVRPEIVAVIGLLLFLTRPESALAIILLPFLLFLLMPTPALSKRSIATLLGLFFVGVVLELVVCNLYFHTVFPLSFYMKGKHAYEGYREVWHPELLMLAFLAGCQIYLAALILLGRRQDWRLIVCCLAPAGAVFAYLGTVTQIMGFNARYYTPYFAFFIVPALLLVDRWLIPNEASTESRWPRHTLLLRSGATALLMLCFLALSSEGVQATVRRLEARPRFEYEPAHLDIAAGTALPEKTWQEIMTNLTDLLISPLPKGTTVAATEVGYLGSKSPQANIIDLAGLNDTDIALHGFDMARLLKRKPDIIWMPNTSYTYQRGLMFSDPALLAQYDVYDGAANYGLAIRKDSPSRPQIDQQMQAFWSAVYPGYEKKDYLVRSATWSGRKFKVVGD
ncbi:hypothetical protein [Granulicella sp. S190]|uniref:hypothetical protein n=1 Tax=Granulicella sp. S190 TaxID=1747226 RepID=UPI00131D6974|nr:hypothetical protein [Granulicella sp. S190]